jgi:hypothetical protein
MNATASSRDPAWTAMARGEEVSVCASVRASSSRPARSNSGGNAGLVREAIWSYTRARVLTRSGTRSSRSDSQTWTSGISSIHAYSFSASSTTMSRHTPSSRRVLIQLSLSFHLRDVTKTKTLSKGDAEPGLLVRLR